MLAMPAPTKFDLNFRLLGVPVQVSPFFWLAAVLLGPKTPGEVAMLLTWVACMFGSILVHEFGHALTAKSFGERPRVALWWMGGLCSSNEDDRQSPRQRLAVLIMGPGAQILLLMLVFLVGWAAWGITWRGNWLLIKDLFGLASKHDLAVLSQGQIELIRARESMGRVLFNDYWFLLTINLFWALVNLLPIYPLDGGQIAQVLLTQHDRVHGTRRTHILSMVTAGIVAALAATRMQGMEDSDSLMPVLFFGYFAFMNYQALRAHHQHFVDHGPDDADWWKR